MHITLKRTKADKLFSQFIRERAEWVCERCHVDCVDNHGYLDCSHFHSRAKKSVRFDPDNAAALCKKCHDYIGKNIIDHEMFFFKRLGLNGLNALSVRAGTPQKVDENLICQGLEIMLEELRKKDETIGKRS